jgi:nucleoside-diphosphate-sugar epimerase
MPKRVLVTGASGFIGSHIVRRLIRDGHAVSVLARPTSSWERLKDVAGSFTVIPVDITDAEALLPAMRALKPEWIFHMANAGLYGGASGTDAQVVRVNVLGLVNLLEALHEVPYEVFVNGASSAEYGPKHAPMKESDVCEPMSTYAVTKLAATSYATMVARLKGKPIVSTRFFSPYGPGDDERRLVPTLIRTMLAGKEATVAPEAMRDYIYIDDAVDALVALAEHPDKTAITGQIVNLGTGTGIRARQVVDVVAAATAVVPKVTWNNTQLRYWDSSVWQADMTKTFSLTSWRPKTSFEQGVAATVSWIRNNPLS